MSLRSSKEGKVIARPSLVQISLLQETAVKDLEGAGLDGRRAVAAAVGAVATGVTFPTQRQETLESRGVPCLLDLTAEEKK